MANVNVKQEDPTSDGHNGPDSLLGEGSGGDSGYDTDNEYEKGRKMKKRKIEEKAAALPPKDTLLEGQYRVKFVRELSVPLRSYETKQFTELGIYITESKYDRCLVVSTVVPGSLADGLGVQPGDLFQKVNGEGLRTHCSSFLMSERARESLDRIKDTEAIFYRPFANRKEIPPAPAEETPGAPLPQDLESLTLGELKSIAEDRGVKKGYLRVPSWETCCPPTAKKSDIIDELRRKVSIVGLTLPKKLLNDLIFHAFSNPSRSPGSPSQKDVVGCPARCSRGKTSARIT